MKVEGKTKVNSPTTDWNFGGLISRIMYSFHQCWGVDAGFLPPLEDPTLLIGEQGDTWSQRTLPAPPLSVPASSPPMQALDTPS